MSQSGGFPDYGASGEDRFGSGGDPYSSGSDPYGSGAGYDPYASGSGQGANSDSFAENGARYSPPVFGESAADPYSAVSTQSSAYSSSFDAPPTVPPGYRAGGHPGPYAPPPPTSGAALTGFILGLCSYITCGLSAPVGLVFSIMGMKSTAPTASPLQGGRGFAIAGLVTSILGTLYLLGIIAYFVLVVLLAGAGALSS